ncbi:MAG: hypothetical protein AAF633_07220 [Chloroflexota bacterium]
MSHQVHKFWLKVTAVGIAFFGPIFFLGTMEATLEPARWSLDLLAWPIDGNPSYASEEMRFLSALTGGFLFGWGVMVWCLSTWVYDAAPEGVRRSVLTGLSAWFVLDSLGSITSGAPSNAFFNIIVLLILVGPLWVPAKKGRAIQPTNEFN